MSHRKFEHPRHGSLAYLPKRRTRHHRGRVRSFPRDDASKPIHLTAFMGYKAGMTHVIECPPMKIIGLVGYIQTPRGMRALSTVWAQNLDNDVKRRFYKNWMNAKKKAFSKYVDRKYKSEKTSKTHYTRDLERIKKYATVVRVLCATQIRKLAFRQHKAHLLEIQVNGGDIAAKVDWANSKFEQEVRVGEVFEQSECIDCIGVSKGHGTMGVVGRFDVKRLQRKSHRGCRKVACIGAWHPSAVKWTVPRRGQ